MLLPRQGDVLLARYALEAPVGEGATSVVFAARNLLVGHRIAVKVIRPEIVSDACVARRFVERARAAARLRNDHLTSVFDVGTLACGLPFMVLEYLDGASLARALAERGPLRRADVIDYLLQTIEALAHAHALGIVHGDLRPSHLFLASRPDRSRRLKVLDLGLSRAGSNCVDRHSDLFALGAVAHELLNGRAPPSVNAAITRCMKPAPGERFATVGDLAAELVPFASLAGVRAFDNTARLCPSR
jgi:serine/threonine protein kinase